MRLDTADTILDCIDHYAHSQPAARAAIFVADGDAREETIDHGELQRRARALAAALIRHGVADAPVVLLYHSGIDFLIGFFACLYAGAPAVPANVPRNHRRFDRLRLILTDAGSRAVLTTDDVVASMPEGLNAEALGLQVLTESAVTDADVAAAADVRRATPEGIAFLQYTSGSTGAPKGVMVTHGQLLANLRAIRDTGAFPEFFCAGGWLPQFHDMGLVGMSLSPIAMGGQVAFISPLHFLQRPLRWLRLIHRYRIRISPAPNFALDLLGRVPREHIPADLDLSSLWGLYCGAESVRSQTLARFHATYAPFGLAEDAVKPCYGLAEATLIVSGGATAPEHRLLHVDRKALEEGRALPVSANGGEADDANEGGTEGAQSVVCCGSVVPGHRLIVVDPDTGARRADGEVGELWFSGPSTASGYWRNEAATAATFGAVSPDCEGAFMRTGDLGFMHDDRVYVTGRIKELIIIRGRNYYPTDLESTIVEAAGEENAKIAASVAAVFATDDPNAAAVNAVFELPRGLPADAVDREAILRCARNAVMKAHDLTVKDLIVVEQGGIPRTSSGKLQRGKCAEMHRKGVFAAESTADGKAGDGRPAANRPADAGVTT